MAKSSKSRKSAPKAPARLEFREVHPSISPATSPAGEIPPGYELMTLDDERDGKDISEELFVKRIPAATGESLIIIGAE